MSKEKRIAEKAEKSRIANEKRAMEVEKILGGKRPVSQAVSPSAKVPKDPAPKGGVFPLPVVVSPEKEDRKGVWSWGVRRDWHPNPGNAHIDGFLKQYHGAKTWREVFEEQAVGKGCSVKLKHIKYSVSDICPEAQSRLGELKLDDFEEIFRFRMTNLERLYGFIGAGGRFLTVWYDPNHKIYPLD